RGGYLGTVGRGRFVPAFDSVAWQLAPGGMSGVVRSPFGFHIIRRPPLEEARDSFRADLETAMAARFDSAYVEGLATQRNLKVESGAAALVRQTIQDIGAAVDDTRKLATYRGGTFRVGELARWLYAIDPRDLNGIAAANETQLTDFVRHLAQRARSKARARAGTHAAGRQREAAGGVVSACRPADAGRTRGRRWRSPTGGGAGRAGQRSPGRSHRRDRGIEADPRLTGGGAAGAGPGAGAEDAHRLRRSGCSAAPGAQPDGGRGADSPAGGTRHDHQGHRPGSPRPGRADRAERAQTVRLD